MTLISTLWFVWGALVFWVGYWFGLRYERDRINRSIRSRLKRRVKGAGSEPQYFPPEARKAFEEYQARKAALKRQLSEIPLTMADVRARHEARLAAFNEKHPSRDYERREHPEWAARHDGDATSGY